VALTLRTGVGQRRGESFFQGLQSGFFLLFVQQYPKGIGPVPSLLPGMVGEGETVGQAMQRSNDLVLNTDGTFSIVQRAHALQDGVSSNHYGQTWNDHTTFLEKVAHIVRDTFPSPDTVGEAYNRTKGLLRGDYDKGQMLCR
jgi:hypothetical protein